MVSIDQTKPILRLGFVDCFDGVADFFTDWLAKDYFVIRDDKRPDYLIFCDENFGTKNLEYNDCIKIFYTGENRRPQNYRCHYAITFDHFDTTNHFRLPLYVLVDWMLDKKMGVYDDYVSQRTRMDITKKSEFCGFVQSNPNCVFRNEFYHKLSQYKQITSAGPLFNNTGYVLPRGDDGIIKKLDFYQTCKFSLCFENGQHPGYATEKLYEGWLGGTIPIYWGSSTVALDFNKDAFINWHDFKNDEECIQYIKHVDKHSPAYESIYENGLFRNTRFGVFERQFRNWFGGNVYKGVING